MSIFIDEKRKVFHLQTEHTSYIMHVVCDKYLAHVYWGKRILTPNMDNSLIMGWSCFDVMVPQQEGMFSLDYISREYATANYGDYRMPSLTVEYEDGSRECPLIFHSYERIPGKHKLKGLPATYSLSDDDCETIDLILWDEVMQLYVHLYYTVFEGLDVITRSVVLENKGEHTISLCHVSSASVDFETSDWDLVTLPGAWGRERHVERMALRSGIQSIGSRRGASSHQMNPFLALVEPCATETTGTAYAMNLVYSGNFHGGVEVDQLGKSRMYLGLGDENFRWRLEAGKSFTAPEVVMVHTDEGLGEMSRIFHRLYRTRLIRGAYKEKERPILINNWEATYFDFDENKIVSLAKEASKLGIELLVLDDGWFGQRNDDTSSLGDWFVNEAKLPNGISGLAEKVRENGIEFGLWMEPEMISENSRLYQEHKDWCLQVKGRERSQCRHQLTLDLSRKDVCAYLINVLANLLNSAPISYVKWDMNRHMSNVGSLALPPEQQGEVAHRYMLGLYQIIDSLTLAFPDVLFESCSGGGGRFDPGMLYYMPQTWTSDDTDPIERLKIQYGTSMVYPISTMGAHVSAVPNHQSGRVTPLKTRGDVAMSGNFGYELDLSQFTDVEKDEVKQQIEQYKEIRGWLMKADMYRLRNPFEDNICSWMYLSEQKDQFFLVAVQIMAQVNYGPVRLKCQGLEPEAIYKNTETGISYSGGELMEIGIATWFHGDYQSQTWIFERQG